jgi:hypothetical protein
LPPPPDLDARVARLEEITEKLIAYARSSAAGRMLLRKLGLS